MDRAVQGEVELHVPLEPIDDRTLAADPQIWRKRIGDRVRDDVPMARRGLRVRAVGPELGDRPVEVARTHDVRRVGATGRRIAGVPVTAVGSKSVRADGTGPDVDRRVARNIEQAAVADDLEGLRLVERIGRRIAEPRRWTGVERHALRATGGNRERGDVPPVRADRCLHAARQHDAVLAQQKFHLERLPAIRIDDPDIGERHDERRIHFAAAQDASGGSGGCDTGTPQLSEG